VAEYGSRLISDESLKVEALRIREEYILCQVSRAKGCPGPLRGFPERSPQPMPELPLQDIFKLLDKSLQTIYVIEDRKCN